MGKNLYHQAINEKLNNIKSENRYRFSMNLKKIIFHTL